MGMLIRLSRHTMGTEVLREAVLSRLEEPWYMNNVTMRAAERRVQQVKGYAFSATNHTHTMQQSILFWLLLLLLLLALLLLLLLLLVLLLLFLLFLLLAVQASITKSFSHYFNKAN